MTRWFVTVSCVVTGAAALVAQAPGMRAPSGPAPVATGTALILGQVVDGSTGKPVSTATVTLTTTPAGGAGANGAALGRGNPAAMTGPLGGSPAQRLLVDSDGRFVFHDLPKGTVALAAAAPGYINGAAGETIPSGTSRPIDLTDGERLGDVRIRLWKYAVLSGTVTDESGDPAVGVTVRALKRTIHGSELRLSSSAQATTDDRGQFRIAKLVPADYLVVTPQTQATLPVAVLNGVLQGMASGGGSSALMDVMMSGGPAPNPLGVQVGDYLLEPPGGGRGAPLPPTADGRLLEYQTVFFPTGSTPAQASVITLQSGDEHGGVNVQLRLAPTRRISGLVSGPDGPMPNVGVTLWPAGFEGIDESSLQVAQTATNADGSFLFLGVPPGQYVARVVKPPRPQLPPELASNPLMQMTMGSSMSSAPTGTAALALYGRLPVAVGSADVTGVALTLSEGAKLSGHLEFVGSAAPPTPQQLQNINIVVLNLDGTTVEPGAGAGALGAMPTGGGRGVVGADSQFKTPGYPPGRYFVTSSAVPGRSWTIESVVANGHDVLTEPIDLSNADVGGIVVTFTDKATTVTGIVHGAGTAVVDSGTVMAFPIDYQTWLANGMSPRRTRSAPISKTGAYTLNTLLTGDYYVAAMDDADAAGNHDAAFFEALSHVATRASVAAGDKRSLDLTIVRLK